MTDAAARNTHRVHREETLALFAVALRPPSGSTALGDVLDALRQRAADDSEIAGLIDEAARASRGLRMDREYHRLFLGPNRPVAPPSESVYHEGRTHGRTSTTFVEELRAVGLELSETSRLPPDHVAVELEFLAQLEARARIARNQGRHGEAEEWSQRARTLIDERMARWLPPFLARLRSGAPRSPYTALVRAAALVIGIRAGPKEMDGDG